MNDEMKKKYKIKSEEDYKYISNKSINIPGRHDMRKCLHNYIFIYIYISTIWLKHTSYIY